MDRASGVLAHITSLPGSYSSGGFSFEEAKHFIDFLADSGFSWWQVLPFGPVDTFHSPYTPVSAFGGNPYFVDPEALFSEGLISEASLARQRQKSPYLCEYGRLERERIALLAEAAENYRDREKVRVFLAENPRLEEFCVFMALKDKNGGLPWTEWKEKRPDEERLFLWEFIQYVFFHQWEKILTYAHSRGVKVIGDVPFYMALDSADVRSHPEQFRLLDGIRPEAVAGVPPDYFAKDGQLWGNPLYNWTAMEQDGFSWWRSRMRQMYSLFDGVRLDHFRGMESYWAVPYGAKTAREGRWEKGPGMHLTDAIRQEAGEKLVIAEDLGEITPEVVKLRECSGFPGMRVFQFAFLSHDGPHMPHRYMENCVAYTGTHDNNTLLGYLWETAPSLRSEIMRYCGYDGDDWDQHGCAAIVRTLLESSAGLVMFPIQDLLGYGSDTRLNRPGTTEGNWAYRVTREQIDSLDRSRLRSLNALYRRI